MADVTLAITGLETVLTNMNNLFPTVHTAGAWALYQEAVDILEKSKPLVPIDTGALFASGMIESTGTPGSGGTLTVTIQYGGGEVDYAAIVHEDTSMRHPNGGQSHYLSEPYFAATAGMLDRLAGRIRARMR